LYFATKDKTEKEFALLSANVAEKIKTLEALEGFLVEVIPEEKDLIEIVKIHKSALSNPRTEEEKREVREFMLEVKALMRG
tara:strand:- start:1193 stop:1435 length:243 start_codon:yes stop_codon:yes gene_type:complete